MQLVNYLDFRLDRNRNGVGVIIYGREDTFSKKLKMHDLIADIEVIYVELNLRKTK